MSRDVPAASGAGRLALLIAAVMLMPLAIDIYLPSLPVMARDLGQPSSALQVTITLLLFSVGLGQILVGPLTDRFGRRPALLLGSLLYGLGALLAMSATTLLPLYFSRVLQGLGACAATTVAFAAVRDLYTPAEGARLYSYLNGSLCLIPALAPVVGGVLAVQLGWRSNFAFMALFALVLLATAFATFGETRPRDAELPRPLYRLARYRRVLGDRRFLRYAGTAGVCMAAILIYVSAAPVLLVERLGLSELAFAACFGGNALVNIVTFFRAPRVIHRLGRRRTVRLGLGLVLLAGGLQGLAAWALPLSVAAFMGPVAVLSVGFSLTLGAASSLALEPFRGLAGTAAALLGALQLGGGAVLASLMLATPLSLQMALAAMATLPVALLLVTDRASRPA
ncbi:Bcr/CflA family efflux MFS transporter [Modicisalibacter tunisiensis]|uniref:Bcr/CflA family efflux transporter n=1 Tax=Modicisalibacter tunisiensis TaxID=390637 RepID=A0ABS7X388_9GAMM|nr:Bcr/CflA family efflux MFS transporter [Modicisalibacter tunisiensis]MBZ9537508.1 Bcr/CflA family efflux MFS transporter [Modicisalibacter tunisiensis]MBZ9569070.1 Bcr/CflA family efflux MFS transporter [Modicisalibacter tunisiensis]